MNNVLDSFLRSVKDYVTYCGYLILRVVLFAKSDALIQASLLLPLETAHHSS